MIESLYEKIVGLIETGIIVLEKNSCVITWNHWMTLHSGIDEADAKGLPITDIIPELKGSRIELAINKALQFNCPSVLSAKLIDASFPLYKDQITDKNQPDRIVQSILIKPFFQDGEGQHCVISIVDISSSDLREKALRNQSTTLNNVVSELQEKDYELQTIFQNTQNAIIIFDQSGDILNANPAASEILHLNNKKLTKYKIYNLIEGLSPDSFGHSDSENLIRKQLPEKGTEQEMLAMNAKGAKIPVSLSSNIIPYEEQSTRFFIFFRDITEKKRTEDQLYHMARFDSLTNLYNRASFSDILNRSIQSHHRASNRLSVFFIDLDRFKIVNDKLGHDAGDILLQKVAERLSSCCRTNDIIARWAGDEFVILLEQQERQRSSITVAEKILKSFKKSFLIKNQETHIGCSIGIAQFPDDGNNPETLISNADQAMYQAKSEGKGQFRFFTTAMNERMLERLRIESELRTALKKQQFTLHFQPQVSVINGTLAGVEALVRWNHPENGMVLPAKFIKVAEECGLISQIGDQVLKSAIEMAAQWHKSEGATLPISINLSAIQFIDENLVSKLKKLIDSVGIPADSIILEITENHLVGESRNSLMILNALKAIGVKIAIDDFGTGYSSLAYLRKLPVDIIKIDRAFLIDASTNKTNAHIISAIIELSHALNLEVVAEGIETDQQLELLQVEGCDLAQGFLFAKPMDIDALQYWFHHYNVTSLIAH